ncbi:MAG: sulfatase-like hydrolase/transferase [Rikenellaceae bacterium]
MNANLKSSALIAVSISSIYNVAAATKPNLLVIHTDEHNFRTLSCYQRQLSKDQAFVWGEGVNVETPNIDRIADEGAICNRHYCSTAVSTPSRASIVTGLYPQATGAYKNGMFIREDIPTFATILRDNGYSTSYIGKWHLAGDETQYQFDIEYNAGFDDNRYMMNGGHKPYFVKGEDGKIDFQNSKYNGVPKERLVHLTDYFTDCTLEIIERDKDNPFCIMVSIPDPHTPDIAKDPYDTMYNHMNPTMPKTMLPEYAENRPQWAFGNTNGEMTKFSGAKLKQYFGMVKHIDDSVGRMLDALDEAGVLDNTIVVFTADHGDMFYEHSRMNKGVPYESSAKIPFVIRYPKKIKAGKVVNTAQVNVDFAPTVLSLMDVDCSNITFHGVDQSAEFVSKGKISQGDYIMMSENNYGSWAMACDSRYKFIISNDEKPWLLDIEADPNEVINYYNDSKYKDVVYRLKTTLISKLKEFESPYLNSYILE